MYWYEKKINILKRKCHVEINVVFLVVIWKLYDVCFMKTIFIAPMNMFAPFRPSYNTHVTTERENLNFFVLACLILI